MDTTMEPDVGRWEDPGADVEQLVLPVRLTGQSFTCKAYVKWCSVPMIKVGPGFTSVLNLRHRLYLLGSETTDQTVDPVIFMPQPGGGFGWEVPRRYEMSSVIC